MKQTMVHLREIPPSGLADGVLVIAALPSKAEAELAFLGPLLPDDVAKSIAEGKLVLRVSSCMMTLAPRHSYLLRDYLRHANAAIVPF